MNTIAKLLFAFFLCAGLLVFEKFAIQWIAGKFHERSYAGEFVDSLKPKIQKEKKRRERETDCKNVASLTSHTVRITPHS